MAPNGTFYGAMKIGEVEEQPKSGSVNKLLVAAGVVVMVTLGVFALSATASNTVTSVVDEDVPGSAATKGPDCRCRSACDAVAHSNGFHYCDVVPSDVCDDDDGDGKCGCIGIDGKFFSEGPEYDSEQPCMDSTGAANGNCRAVCEYVYGRYDCWSFPCFNGGFCVDGVDVYTCTCAFGYDGEQCENDIDECLFENADTDDVEGDDVFAVCDEHAMCTNSDGDYSCVCEIGRASCRERV